MTAQFIQDDGTLDYTPVSDTPAGSVIVQGELVAVAPRPIPAGTLGGLAVEGIFDFSKATGGGTAITAGTKVYWDPVSGVATATAGSLKYLGKTTRDAADADTKVRVRLQQ